MPSEMELLKDSDLVADLGGKGAGLADMCHVGVPVPPGYNLDGRVSCLLRRLRDIPGRSCNRNRTRYSPH